MIGEVLGNRYELIEKIGEGGMAIVYKARDNKLNRLVAVKILKKEFANNKDISDKFKKEATALANFSDANIVNILDVGHEEEGNIDYFVMEYVSGKTLKELIVENGKLNYTVSIGIATQIAKALECAHKNNIIHRDVKPQNILVTESGMVKVTDFGIAKSSTSATITNTTTIMGSAHYLSPEQAKGTFIDLRSDIYSLGIVLYEMVTGILPFDAESPVTIALKHIQSEPIDPKKYAPSIPDGLNNLIIKCMSKEPINRYQNCRELINDLQKIKENPNTSINAKMKYDDDRTIIMEPIRPESIVNTDVNVERKKSSYTKADFENDEDENEEEHEEDFRSSTTNLKKNNNSKKNNNNKNKTIIIIGAIAIAVLLIGGIAFGYKSLTGGNSSISSSKTVPVPDITGMTVENATKELKKVGLKIKVVETIESDKEENTIVEMNPVADTEAKKGDTIEVKISGGLSKVIVPDLRDYDVNYIKDLLKQKGLDWNINYQYSENIKSGYLISQYPERDSEVVKGSVIELTISQGKKEKFVSVSNYLGQNVDNAKKNLESLGLTVILKEQSTDKESENGIVLSQSLESGTKISAGAKITLTYGKYTPPSDIDVSQYLSVGMSLADATSALNSAGISYSISGANVSGSDMSLYVVKGFTNKIKQGESVKIQVEKIKVPEQVKPNEPNEPNEDNKEPTNPEGGDGTNDGNNKPGDTDVSKPGDEDSEEVGAGVNSGGNNTKPGTNNSQNTNTKPGSNNYNSSTDSGVSTDVNQKEESTDNNSKEPVADNYTINTDNGNLSDENSKEDKNKTDSKTE
ncbi:Stk1 family PASTA domain-containing Ser/Thr kinase [Clostridium sp.]|jgi:serine/threonine protein kinase|uniref:Stk1 family PASTA domain-containing Ser/Thr kinase n=2 Tax=Clostridium TaxID=1485 RepID=UPI0025BBA411|nr:Stk1 family PASTA domain-containing Ser/Thr kinase [Clostridium sp.]MCI9069575.1 Stk1 family PASTA domain-containing Ser/Thr kinase [Clostridium sp.]MCI9303600.1 Stk1 family PASTA domain-containing Ser/Thr kinase [Clostridium sp.]